MLLHPGRIIMAAGGERAGKSFVSGLFGATRSMFGSNFWIVAATYDLARPEFEYWIDFLGNLGAIRKERDISLPKIGKATAVLKSGQIIETKTADDVRKLAAKAPDGIIMAEAAQLPYEAYLKCLGRVAEKRGWVLMSGTFEGSLGWYPEKFTEWMDPRNFEHGRSFSLPSWSNHTIYPEGREDPEIKRLEALYSRVEGLFEERCGAVPVPPATLIFREFRTTIHVDASVCFDPKLPVFLAVDPSSGGDPYAVLACQFHKTPLPLDGKELPPDMIDTCHIIDEYYDVGEITEDIILELKTRPWWKNVKGGAIDDEAPDERKRWVKYGKVPLLAQRVEQFQGIRRLKSFLFFRRDKETNIIIERPHLLLSPLIDSLPFEFSRYKRKPNPEDTTLVVEKPPTNQPDHSIKALWYLLIARYGDVKSYPRSGVVKTWKRPRL